MEYATGRRVPLQRVPVTPFAVATSECNTIAAITLQGVHLFVSYLLTPFSNMHFPRMLFLLCLLWGSAFSLDFTDQVFEGKPEGLLAAFGDFNSDKLTDIFVVDNDLHSFSILLAYTESPYIRKSHLDCSLEDEIIASLVPGDFDGDGAMDVLILTKRKGYPNEFNIYMAWGSLDKIECPKKPILETYGQPLVMDYNSDMISDLFGLDTNKTRQFWIFNTSRMIENKIQMEANDDLRIPHSHGFLDLNGDSSTDLLLTAEKHFEFWSYVDNKGFQLGKKIPLPVDGAVIGQSIYVDVNFDGKMDHLVPVCVDYKCRNSTFYMYDDNWHTITCDLQDPSGNIWTFQPPDSNDFYLNSLTARSGDFNLDGYPDLLITLTHAGEMRAVLLENVPLESRFIPRWDLLTEWNNTSVMATMYDIEQKGILDVLLVHKSNDGHFRMAAYKNTLDYDANFIKVVVLTGRCYGNCTHNRIPYGTNLPGPSISYRTTQPNGEPQLTCSAQLSQSAYNALQLPYTLFGLARSPNFLETLRVGISYYPGSANRDWTQIIPNSQMIIIPTLAPDSHHWLNKLFVTPSRAIVLSAGALAGFGFLLAVVVCILHCRERRADKLEQLAVANRFHFDAM